jgi:multidrug efflux pump subunit AcrB
VFGLAIVFVFLILAMQYESWSMPFMVLLAVPLALFGALLALWVRGVQLDVYSQIGFIMLIGLSAKNAILIVEFAKHLRERGLGIVEAAMEAGRLRLRPILMTAFAFILGVVPLMVATGAGAASRQSIGTTVFGGDACGHDPDASLRSGLLRRHRAAAGRYATPIRFAAAGGTAAGTRCRSGRMILGGA